jgi:hypothetical protein
MLLHYFKLFSFQCSHYANEVSSKLTHSGTFETYAKKSGRVLVRYAIFSVSNGRVCNLLSLLSVTYKRNFKETQNSFDETSRINILLA